MTILPTIDLGLMAEHLSTLEGVINKLVLYETKVTNIALKEILVLQAKAMRNHVKVMLALINPHQNGYIQLQQLNEYTMNSHPHVLEGQEGNADNKWIASESHNTAQSMSNENYISALTMKNQNIRNIHSEIALQQFTLQGKYTDLI